MAYSQSINLLTTKLKIKLYQTNTCDGNIGYTMAFLSFTGYIIIENTYQFVSWLQRSGIDIFVLEIAHRETQRVHGVAQRIIYFFLSVSSCLLRALRVRIVHRVTRSMYVSSQLRKPQGYCTKTHLKRATLFGFEQDTFGFFLCTFIQVICLFLSFFYHFASRYFGSSFS